MKLAAVLGLLLLGLVWWVFRTPAVPPPALIAGLADEGFSGAPCPARSLYEQDARKKRGVRKASAFAERLRQKFPLGSPASALRDALLAQGFEPAAPCANDESVLGLRWRAQNWGESDAYVYWREDISGKIDSLDGHVSRAE